MSDIYFLFSQGHVSAALVLGGVDDTGAHLFNIYPHGSSDTVPFCTMGSGSLAAMSVFESNWKPNMTVSEQNYLLLKISLFRREGTLIGL